MQNLRSINFSLGEQQDIMLVKWISLWKIPLDIHRHMERVEHLFGGAQNARCHYRNKEGKQLEKYVILSKIQFSKSYS